MWCSLAMLGALARAVVCSCLYVGIAAAPVVVVSTAPRVGVRARRALRRPSPAVLPCERLLLHNAQAPLTNSRWPLAARMPGVLSAVAFIAQPQALCTSTPHVKNPIPRRQITIHSGNEDTSSFGGGKHGGINAWVARLTVLTLSPCAQPPSPELTSTSGEGSARGQS